MADEELKKFFLEIIDEIVHTIKSTGILTDAVREEIATSMYDFTTALIEANSEKKEQTPATSDQVSILMNIVVWLYTKDKTFESVQEWRKALLSYLSTILNVRVYTDENN